VLDRVRAFVASARCACVRVRVCARALTDNITTSCLAASWPVGGKRLLRYQVDATTSHANLPQHIEARRVNVSIRLTDGQAVLPSTGLHSWAYSFSRFELVRSDKSTTLVVGFRTDKLINCYVENDGFVELVQRDAVVHFRRR